LPNCTELCVVRNDGVGEEGADKEDPFDAHVPAGRRPAARPRRGPCRDPAAVRHLYLRLSDAALQACGAGPESLRDVRAATRRSPCWRAAMLATLRQIGNPALDARFAAREQ
jgi:hypothetical protein